MSSDLRHILNLVRHEAEGMEKVDDPFEMTEQRARVLIESAAVLVLRISLASPEILGRIAERAAALQCQKYLEDHQGGRSVA